MNLEILGKITRFLSTNPNPGEKAKILDAEKKDNGSICKGAPISPEEKMAANKGEADSAENRKEGMWSLSPCRKLGFFLSLQVWVFYVVFFAWILPCRDIPCPNLRMTMKFNASVKGQLIPLAIDEQPPGLILAHSNDALLGLSLEDGGRLWSTPLQFQPKKATCVSLDADGVFHCAIGGDHDLAVVNASNGHLLWRRSVSGLSSIEPIPQNNSTGSSSFLVSMSTRRQQNGLKSILINEMMLLDGGDGRTLRKIDLPCQTIDGLVLLAPTRDGADEWVLGCVSRSATALWSFPGEQLILSLNESSGKLNFRYLIGWENENSTLPEQSADVMVSRISVPTAVTLAWASSVTMVTLEHPRVSWRRTFASAVVTQLAPGYYWSRKFEQLAVIENRNFNFFIHILNASDGVILNSLPVGHWEKVAMWKIASNNALDSLILEARPLSNHNSSSAEDIRISPRRYFFLESGEATGLRPLLTAPAVYGSSVIASEEGPLLCLSSASEENSSAITLHLIRKPSSSSGDC